MWGPHFLCTYTLTQILKRPLPFCWIPSPSNQPLAFLLLAAAPSNAELPPSAAGIPPPPARRAPRQRERTSWACSKPIGWDASGQDGASKVACPGSTLQSPPAAPARTGASSPRTAPHCTAPRIAGSYIAEAPPPPPGRPGRPNPGHEPTCLMRLPEEPGVRAVQLGHRRRRRPGTRTVAGGEGPPGAPAPGPRRRQQRPPAAEPGQAGGPSPPPAASHGSH